MGRRLALTALATATVVGVLGCGGPRKDAVIAHATGRGSVILIAPAACTSPPSLEGEFHANITAKEPLNYGFSPAFAGRYKLTLRDCRFTLRRPSGGMKADRGRYKMSTTASRRTVVFFGDRCSKPTSYTYRRTPAAIKFSVYPRDYWIRCGPERAILTGRWRR